MSPSSPSSRCIRHHQRQGARISIYIRRHRCKGASPTRCTYQSRCTSINANPYTKEVWPIKTHNSKCIFFVDQSESWGHIFSLLNSMTRTPKKKQVALHVLVDRQLLTTLRRNNNRQRLNPDCPINPTAYDKQYSQYRVTMHATFARENVYYSNSTTNTDQIRCPRQDNVKREKD